MTATSPVSSPQEGGGGAGSNGEDDDAWRHDFRLLLSGSALSQLGTLGAAAANPLLALALTGSPIVAGWVAAATTFPGLLLHLPVGLLVDRYDRWRIMLFSQLIRVINSIVLVIGLFLVDEAWPILIVASVIDGSCAVFFRIAELAAVRYVVPDGEAEQAMGKSEARHHLAVVLGRPVGGVLFSMGRALPYVLDAITTIVSVISLLFLRTRALQSSTTTKKPWKVPVRKVVPQFREGFRWLCHDRLMFVSVCACAVANVGFQVVILLLVVEAERRGVPGSVIGVMLAASGVAGFLGALTAPRAVKFFTPAVIVKYCILSWLMLLGIVAFVEDPRVGMVAWGACSFTGAYVNVALAMRQSKVVPSGVLGRVEGVSQFMTTGAVTLGAGGGGYVITAVGTRPTAFLVALVLLVIVIAVFVLIRTPERPHEVEEEALGQAVGEGADVSALDEGQPGPSLPRASGEPLPVGSRAVPAERGRVVVRS